MKLSRILLKRRHLQTILGNLIKQAKNGFIPPQFQLSNRLPHILVKNASFFIRSQCGSRAPGMYQATGSWPFVRSMLSRNVSHVVIGWAWLERGTCAPFLTAKSRRSLDPRLCGFESTVVFNRGLNLTVDRDFSPIHSSTRLNRRLKITNFHYWVFIRHNFQETLKSTDLEH